MHGVEDVLICKPAKGASRAANPHNKSTKRTQKRGKEALASRQLVVRAGEYDRCSYLLADDVGDRGTVRAQRVAKYALLSRQTVIQLDHDVESREIHRAG